MPVAPGMAQSSEPRLVPSATLLQSELVPCWNESVYRVNFQIENLESIESGSGGVYRSNEVKLDSDGLKIGIKTPVDAGDDSIGFYVYKVSLLFFCVLVFSFNSSWLADIAWKYYLQCFFPRR